jgi:hypothetical protein
LATAGGNGRQDALAVSPRAVRGIPLGRRIRDRRRAVERRTLLEVVGVDGTALDHATLPALESPAPPRGAFHLDYLLNDLSLGR